MLFIVSHSHLLLCSKCKIIRIEQSLRVGKNAASCSFLATARVSYFIIVKAYITAHLKQQQFWCCLGYSRTHLTNNASSVNFYSKCWRCRQCYLVIFFQKAVHLGDRFTLNATNEKSRVVREEAPHSTLGRRLRLDRRVFSHGILWQRQHHKHRWKESSWNDVYKTNKIVITLHASFTTNRI